MILVLQSLRNRAEFCGKNLGSLEVPLIEALTPNLGKVTFQCKPVSFGSASTNVDFDPFAGAFSTPRGWAEGCLGWAWCQWLLKCSRGKDPAERFQGVVGTRAQKQDRQLGE